MESCIILVKSPLQRWGRRNRIEHFDSTAVLYRIGSAILLKNTKRLSWDVTTGGLHRRYTLWYAFKTAIILAFGPSGSFSIVSPFPLSNYILFLQPFARGLGQDHNRETCCCSSLCSAVDPFSLHSPSQRSIYMKCQSPWGITWELIICGEWFGPINYGSHIRKRMGLMCHMVFFSHWTRNSLASNINNGFVECRLMTSDRNYRRNLYHFVLL